MPTLATIFATSYDVIRATTPTIRLGCAPRGREGFASGIVEAEPEDVLKEIMSQLADG